MWWRWPTGPEYARRNFVKAAGGIAVLFWSGFGVFLWAGGGDGEQSIVDLDPSAWKPVLDSILDWLNDPIHLLVTAIVLVLLYGNVRRRK